MNEFIEKLIGRLEEEKKGAKKRNAFGSELSYKRAIEIINQFAEEYNNDFCEWNYDEFEEKWQTNCGVLFTLHDSDKEITNYCPCCAKKIKIAPYQPKGE